MTQRTLAAVIALPLVLALVVLSWVLPLPYSIYSPGPTVDVLGASDGEPVVQVEGHRTYEHSGEIRLTTVSETTRDADIGLWTLLGAWTDGDDAIVPVEVAHPDPDLTADDERAQGQAQMAGSQETAAAAALTELGYDVARAGVASVEEGAPADGVLEADDVVLRVAGKSVKTPDELVAAVRAAEPGQPLRLLVERGEQRRTVTVTPQEKDGRAYLGIGVGATFEFPFEVSFDIDSAIGGPSAGLVMAMSVYDVLTPGPLTGGRPIAGTGTIDGTGTVGPIGGIQQKIPGAEAAGAELFLVPADNCADVAGVDPGDMRLVRVESLHDAITSVEKWAEDHDATLPTCGSDA